MSELIKAIKKDEKLVREMDELMKDDSGYHLWWLGQSGFLLQCQGKRILIDPYLSDSLTVKYAATDKPHIRMSERVIDPDLLRGINVVTSSHNHTDHLDAETLKPILANNPGIQFIIPEANREFVAARVECEPDFPTGLSDGRFVTIDGFSFYGIPAKHNEVERDANGLCKFMGYVIECDALTVYHSGDTLWLDGLEGMLRPFNIDIAILPINGNDPARKVAGNLNAEEAARLAKAVGAKNVIPCHYDMFTFNTADVKDFEAAAQRIGQPFVVLKGGEKFSGKKATA